MEQDHIVSILAPLERKISINNQLNDYLLKLGETIYLKLMASESLTESTIKNISKSVVCGKTPSTKNKKNYGNEMLFITIPDMHNQIIATHSERMLSKVGAESQKNKTLPENSVLVSCIGTVGLVSLNAQECQTNQQINSIIPLEGVSPYWVFFCVRNLATTIERLGSSGSTICNLNKAQFEKIEIQIPSLQSIADFHKQVEPLFKLIQNNNRENANMRILRDLLLPNLLSGNIQLTK